MIFDKIKNLATYRNTSPRIQKAIDWLLITDLNSLPLEEKIYIDKENVYASVSEYDTYPSYKKTFEGHRKYIDIQLMLSGAEIMEVAIIKGTEEDDLPYDEIKERYKVKTQEDNRILVKEGEFAIFFPQDLHKPCVNYSHKSEKVKKMIVKVLI